MNLKFFMIYEDFFKKKKKRNSKKEDSVLTPILKEVDPSEDIRKKQAESEVIATRSIANAYPDGLNSQN